MKSCSEAESECSLLLSQHTNTHTHALFSLSRNRNRNCCHTQHKSLEAESSLLSLSTLFLLWSKHRLRAQTPPLLLLSPTSINNVLTFDRGENVFANSPMKILPWLYLFLPYYLFSLLMTRIAFLIMKTIL